MKSKFFKITFNNFHGTIDLSLVDEFEDITVKEPQKLYYFNKLYVDKELRNKGIAKQLLEKLEHWADSENIVVVGDVNPYGDLDFEKLVQLYLDHGFVKFGIKCCLEQPFQQIVRYPK